VETRLGVEPSTAGLQPASRASEIRAMASPARLERATCCFASSRAFLLRHGDMECAGEDSNLRVGYLIYSRARSPLRHRRLG
jgi:hypothetical protein